VENEPPLLLGSILGSWTFTRPQDERYAAPRDRSAFARSARGLFTSQILTEVDRREPIVTVDLVEGNTNRGLAMAMGAAVLWHRWWNGEDR
jgi:hypothetical protein